MQILKIVFCLVFSISLLLGHVSAQIFVIRNADVYTGVDPDIIPSTDIIVRGGEIVEIGRNLAAPTGATIIEASGQIATPGIIAPYSVIGLTEISLDQESNDAGPGRDTAFPLGAALRASDAVNPASTLLAVNRAGGVTKALAAPVPGKSIFGGRAAVISLSGGEDFVLRDDAAQIVMMGYAGASRTGDTRMGAFATLRDTLREARRYADNPAAYYQRTRDDRFAFSDLAALGPVLSGEQKLFVHVDSATDIGKLLELKQEFGLNIVIIGGAEAWKHARKLATENVAVILDPLYNLPSQFEDMAANLQNASRLSNAGVSIAFYNPPGFGAHNLRALPQLAGNAVANGLSMRAAIAALTINPARMLGIDQNYGSLEVGKAADIVLWDGDPLEVTSIPAAVIVDGQQVSLTSRQTMLRDRYLDLSRGDLPHAYRGR